MKYEQIRELSPKHSVRKMCKVLGQKEAAYYNWLKRLEKNELRKKDEIKLIETVAEIFHENKEVYGYRKMQKALEKANMILSEYKVRKIMKNNGMYPIVTKKYRPGRKGRSDGRYYENKLNQEFKAKEPNQLWAGDITYIKTKLGYVYLAIIIDLFNREVIGYNISKNPDSELVKRALGNAVLKINDNSSIIFHSDRGAQYSSKSYQNMLEKYGIKGSMSRASCPYDNACSESFFSQAKRERIYRKEYDTIEEVEKDMFEYIELFYNRKRLHSELGYMSPVEYRMLKTVE